MPSTAGWLRRDGIAREWRLNRFDVTLPEAVLRASGNWAAINAQGSSAGPVRTGSEARRTVMNFRLDIANSGTCWRVSA
jgi:hypothetical protein